MSILAEHQQALRNHRVSRAHIDYRRLTLAPQQLAYRECYAAAALYEELFKLVRDERKVHYGSRAVQYLKQYVELAGIREKVWTRLKVNGIPYGDRSNLPVILADRQGHGFDLFEYHNGYYCAHLWFYGGHRYTSFLVDRDCNLQYATLERAAHVLAGAYPEPDTAEQAVWFLREVLRVLPYESIVISSVQDIPPPVTAGLGEEDAARRMTEWQAFVNGVGRSIAPPVRNEVDGSQECTIHVYQELGGLVLRYTVRCSKVGHVQIQEEKLADSVGDYWWAM